MASELQQSIIRQVNHYFSDRSYPRDQFMQKKAEEVEGGWIPFSILLTFKKLKDLTEDAAVLKEALALGSDNENYQMNDEGNACRRNPDKAFLTPKELNKRSIYVKGFNPATITVDVVQKYFDDNGFKTVHIQIRKNMKTKENKPSAFVEFDTEEEANKAADSKFELDGKQMEVYTKQDYFEMKNAEKRAKSQEKKKEQDESKSRMEREAMSATIDKGCVVKFSGTAEECSREDLKAAFDEFGDIAWVDFSRGEPNGYIRYRQEGCAEKAVAALTESKKEVCGKVLELSVLEGEDEVNYWIDTDKKRQAIRNQKRDNSKRRGGRGGRGGRGRGSKRAKRQ
eukprot:m.135348 g.135348  ORF g.135348 m.135348 type:complete len:340 (+) comp9930_c0_seq1:101-1120(+)